jgi:hypothetical protein
VELWKCVWWNYGSLSLRLLKNQSLVLSIIGHTFIPYQMHAVTSAK